MLNRASFEDGKALLTKRNVTRRRPRHCRNYSVSVNNTYPSLKGVVFKTGLKINRRTITDVIEF